jgi:uncharacterized protein YgiM (DUF1202 family)
MVNTKLRHSPLHKRWAALVLVLVVLFTSASALAADEFAVIYNTSRLNLRSGPSADSTWLGTYSPGTWVQISEAPGSWYSVVTPDGKTGYMSRNFLNRGITEYTTIATVLNSKPTQFLNLRKEPNYNAQVLGIYYNGTPAPVLGNTGGWYLVSVDGTLGYFRGEYLKIDAMIGSDDIATIVTPNNTGLNLRTGPGTKYPSIRQFKGGRFVMVLNRGDGWWKVSIDGYQGYMNTDFLQEGILINDGSGSAAPKEPYALVKNPKSTQVLYLRESASQSGNVLGQYKNGTRLTVLNQGSEWSYVTVDETGKTGFMMSNYLAFYNLPVKPMMTVTHPDGTFVNLRSGPSMTGTKVLKRMSDGDKVEVLIPGSDWVKVRYGNITGYAAKAFLE